MKIKFDVTGAVEKLTGFSKSLEGKGNLDAHFEVEFGADEMGMMLEAKKSLVPEIFDFIKEMQQMTEERNKAEEIKLSDVEKNKLETKIGILEVQLKAQEERYERLKKDKEFWKEQHDILMKGGEKKEEEKVNPKSVL